MNAELIRIEDLSKITGQFEYATHLIGNREKMQMAFGLCDYMIAHNLSLAWVFHFKGLLFLVVCTTSSPIYIYSIRGLSDRSVAKEFEAWLQEEIGF